MSDPVPLKMSQFEISSAFPAGSYFIAVVPSGSSFTNVRVELDEIMLSRWKSVPASSVSAGNDGDEARDGSYYYLHSGGVWYRYSGEIFP